MDQDNLVEQQGYTILKARFRSESAKRYGTLIMVFGETTYRMEQCNVIVSPQQAVWRSDIKESWLSLDDEIMKRKWAGDQDASMTNDIYAYIISHIQADVAHDFHNFISDKSSDYVKDELLRIFYRPIGALDTQFEFSFDKQTPEAYNALLFDRQQREIEQQPIHSVISQIDDIRIAAGSGAIEAIPVQAPSAGIPINMLQIGQHILVYLDPKEPESQALYNRLSVHTEGGIVLEREAPRLKNRIIPVEVYQTGTTRNGDLYVIGHASSNIYICFTVKNTINVRLFNPSTDHITVSVEDTNEFLAPILTPSDRLALFWVIMAVGICSFAGIGYILVFW